MPAVACWRYGAHHVSRSPTTKRALTALALLLGLPLSVVACIWDRDTPLDEARGLPEVVAVLTGRFDRNPPLFYEMRLEHVTAHSRAIPMTSPPTTTPGSPATASAGGRGDLLDGKEAGATGRARRLAARGQGGVPIATEQKPTIFRMTVVQRPSCKRRFPRKPGVTDLTTPNQDIPLLGNCSPNRFLASIRLRWVSIKPVGGFTRGSGSARVSTEEQSLDLQLDALKKAGCKRVFTDKASAVKGDRPGLAEAVSHLRSGDVLVIWKLDRLGRAVKGLVEFVADLQEQGVQFRSLTDGIDTTTPAGRFFFHVMASLAQMERELMTERTRAGLDAGAAAGPGRWPQAADDTREGGVGPQAPEGRDGASERGPESRGFNPDALPLGPGDEPMTRRF